MLPDNSDRKRPVPHTNHAPADPRPETPDPAPDVVPQPKPVPAHDPKPDTPPGDPEHPDKPVAMNAADPATPQAEIEPGEQARTDNDVKARDAFGKPRTKTEWSREAITTHTTRPTLDGPDDDVAQEHARKLKQ